MIRIGLSLVVMVAVARLSAGTTAYAQEPGTVRAEGRRLDEALEDLRQRGLKIIYSTEVVRPGMRVPAETRASSLRRLLDEMLSPHGLIARNGPGGTVLIVKNPRARTDRPPPPKSPAPPPVAAVATGVTAPRFEETVEVTDKEPGAAASGPPAFAVRPLEVRTLAGGFENVFRTVQTLPGVTGTDELGSRIAVRGGSPDQNLTIMDGVEIHNPYRLVFASEDLALVGLASTFNPETIESVEFIPGAFDVRYGDRLSSLLVVKNREGSEAEALQGSAFLGIADAHAIIEGQLPRRTAGSWLVSARRSHLNLVAERALGATLPSFQDVHARVSWRPRPGQRVSFVGLAARERTRRVDSAASDAGNVTKTRNDLLALTFESSLGSRGSSRTIASFSQLADVLDAYERSFDNSRGANTLDSIATGGLLEFQVSRDIAISDLAIRQELVFKPSTRHWFDLGVETHRLETRWAWRIAGARSQQQPNGSSIRLGAGLPAALDSSLNSYRLGAWLQDRWRISPRLVVQPGLRVDRNSATGQATMSPRVSGIVSLGHAVRLDAALAVHTQSPGYEKVLQSDYFIDLSPAQSATLGSERALHAVAGLQKTFSSGLSARVDAYYKRLSDLVVGRLETDDERLTRLSGYEVPSSLSAGVPTGAEITTWPANTATGRAYGMEVYVAHSSGGAASPLRGWVAYSLGRADRTAYGLTHPFDYDRRHAVSMAVHARLGARLDLSATGRWATGLPRTPVRGVRLALIADSADVDGDGNRHEQVPQRDELGHPVFQPDLGGVSNINAARLPPFGRLDARLNYRPTWSGERWAFYLDLINVLNAKNIAQIDSALVFDPTADRPAIVERVQDQGIPFFPSFGIRFWF